MKRETNGFVQFESTCAFNKTIQLTCEKYDQIRFHLRLWYAR